MGLACPACPRAAAVHGSFRPAPPRGSCPAETNPEPPLKVVPRASRNAGWAKRSSGSPLTPAVPAPPPTAYPAPGSGAHGRVLLRLAHPAAHDSAETTSEPRPPPKMYSSSSNAIRRGSSGRPRQGSLWWRSSVARAFQLTRCSRDPPPPRGCDPRCASGARAQLSFRIVHCERGSRSSASPRRCSRSMALRPLRPRPARHRSILLTIPTGLDMSGRHTPPTSWQGSPLRLLRRERVCAAWPLRDAAGLR